MSVGTFGMAIFALIALAAIIAIVSNLYMSVCGKPKGWVVDKVRMMLKRYSARK